MLIAMLYIPDNDNDNLILMTVFEICRSSLKI